MPSQATHHAGPVSHLLAPGLIILLILIGGAQIGGLVWVQRSPAMGLGAMLLPASGALVMVIGLALWMTRHRAARSLDGLGTALTRIAAGDFDTPVAVTGRGDSAAVTAGAVEALRRRAQAAQAEAADAANARETARREHIATRAQTADALERDIGGIASGLGVAAASLGAAADRMAQATGAADSRAQGTAEAVIAAAGNVQAVAAAAEQLSASVAEIARQVAASTAIGHEAVAAASASDRTVAGLSEAASRIGDVVRLIGDIAGQTNLLALNATIEAARAGDAGKGFAVVASEVKILAAQTAKATEEIGAQIGAMRKATEEAVQAVRGIAAAVGRMDEATGAIAAAVEQQGSATREIARNAAGAAAGTDRAAGGMGQLQGDVAAAAEALSLLRAARARSSQTDS